MGCEGTAFDRAERHSIYLPATMEVGSSSIEVEKLVEHRTAHYTAHSEAARYYTNTPAIVLLRFSNPTICRLTDGFKVMSVGNSTAFGFRTGDALYVPPDTEIHIDLGAARADAPITCDCIEIETGRMDNIVSRLNHQLSSAGSSLSARIDWRKFSILRGSDADVLGLEMMMDLFRQDDPMFRDMRIDARIDEMLMSLLQSRSRDLLEMKEADGMDNGITAAVRMIRKDLSNTILNEELARIACMSESSLLRNFKRQFGMTPARFANQLRIKESRRLLCERHQSIETIAFDLGFSSASHFARVFRQVTGETPTEYRNRRVIDVQAVAQFQQNLLGVLRPEAERFREPKKSPKYLGLQV
ncbi:hypothetical protein ASD00_31245 [Ensifer sp. Root31]|uniref:helix-turn-helix domain-containing protein n=1 Tax=Ensifer sp. Root31 TaxID=1736512 RepID=UPI00070BA3FF|nr:AraC family transcriptional regulator [Ensifer sp. Root31]KQU86368.1 hypothetical protein ASD00_31245 [Ensifer sp. Root31]